MNNSTRNLKMKKLLIATTALVATAGMASADITITGHAAAGIYSGLDFTKAVAGLDPTTDTDNSHYENVIINQSPKFKDKTESDFHLTEDSPAIDAGNSSTDGTSDIEGNTRSTPDLGAFEF